MSLWELISDRTAVRCRRFCKAAPDQDQWLVHIVKSETPRVLGGDRWLIVLICATCGEMRDLQLDSGPIK